MQSVAVFGRLSRVSARLAPRMAASSKVSTISSQSSVKSATLATSTPRWREMQRRTYSAAPQSAASVSVRDSELPVKIETISSTLPEDQITQESMLVPLSELVPIPDSFVVVQVGGKQYKVTKDDQIMIEKIDVPVQGKIILDKILLAGTKSFTAIGQPLLTNVKVLAEVEEQALASKVLIFKKKRRHGYKRFKGHRQPYTLLRIVDIMSRRD